MLQIRSFEYVSWLAGEHLVIRDWLKCGRGLAGTVSNHCVFSQYRTIQWRGAATLLREASRQTGGQSMAALLRNGGRRKEVV